MSTKSPVQIVENSGKLLEAMITTAQAKGENKLKGKEVSAILKDLGYSSRTPVQTLANKGLIASKRGTIKIKPNTSYTVAWDKKVRNTPDASDYKGKKAAKPATSRRRTSKPEKEKKVKTRRPRRQAPMAQPKESGFRESTKINAMTLYSALEEEKKTVEDEIEEILSSHNEKLKTINDQMKTLQSTFDL